MEDAQVIREKYDRRKQIKIPNYGYLNPSVYYNEHIKEKKIIQFLKDKCAFPLTDLTLLEIGCGRGLNLLQMIRLGFKPENLFANELLDERVNAARMNLPNGVTIIPGDACQIPLDKQFNIVYQSAVFTSILNEDYKQRVAERMWDLTKPGGAILWYDFTYDNPNNPDVKGIKLREIQSLFPQGKISQVKVTLAPPISRRVTKIFPWMYNLFNCLPFLRTHVLCWIKKME